MIVLQQQFVTIEKLAETVVVSTVVSGTNSENPTAQYQEDL